MGTITDLDIPVLTKDDFELLKSQRASIPSSLPKMVACSEIMIDKIDSKAGTTKEVVGARLLIQVGDQYIEQQDFLGIWIDYLARKQVSIKR